MHDRHRDPSPLRSWSQKKSRVPRVMVTRPSGATQEPAAAEEVDELTAGEPLQQRDRGRLRRLDRLLTQSTASAGSFPSASIDRVNARMVSLSALTTSKSPSPKTGCRLRTWSMPRIQCSSDAEVAICASTLTLL